MYSLTKWIGTLTPDASWIYSQTSLAVFGTESLNRYASIIFLILED